MKGTLYLIGTPIGNLEDLTLRAINTLKGVSAIACEDTRETSKLLRHLDIQKQMLSYHDHNRRTMGPILIEKLLSGDDLALVSDAGMPGISDPGEDLVKLAIEADVPICVIPGPTAFVTALVASGLPTGRFAFEGFLPREPKLRRRRLRDLAGEDRTMIFYEAPHRLLDTLEDMAGQWGLERPAVAGRELTKKFEEYQRGTLGSLLAHFQQVAPRGELVLLVGGGSEVEEEKGDWRLALKEAIAQGQRPSEAAKSIAKAFGVSRQEVYAATLAREED